MRPPDFLSTSAFRSALAVAASFAGLSLLLFAFIYWQTAGYTRKQLDAEIRHESLYIASAPAADAVGRVETWLQEDAHRVRFAALFAADGRPLAGNIPAVPAGLPADGGARTVVAVPIDWDADAGHEVIRTVARPLSDGRLLVVGHDTDRLEDVRRAILRALTLGLAPVLALSLVSGAVLGSRAGRRVRAVHEVIGRVMQGQLGERLPVRGTNDEFGRLTVGVNAMLAEIERLVEEIRGVGDAVAHDLRTPLTRARVRLERSRDLVRTPAEFQGAIDQALTWIDQSLAVITAVLRIGEIEHGRRRAAFARVDLAPLVREVAELYDPIAEEKGVRLAVDASGPMPPTLGDRDLIFEAVVNLVDNAVKFTPRGGEVRLALAVRVGGTAIRVEDTGPGIPAAEREKVLRRFYRTERSRHQEGSGLGLSLVAAVAGLHGFGLTIGGEGGCVVELTCPNAGTASLDAARTRTAALVLLLGSFAGGS